MNSQWGKKNRWLKPIVLLCQVTDYLDVIDEPMDFSTISSRIEDNHYTAMEQFEHDFNLIISNCLRYNAPDTIYYRAALKLRDQGRPIVRAARRQVERAGIDPVTGLHTEEPPTLADREPTEEGEFPATILGLLSLSCLFVHLMLD